MFIAATIRNVIRSIIGKMLSILIILAPPIHGSRILSWKVSSMLLHSFFGILRQLMNLKLWVLFRPIIDFRFAGTQIDFLSHSTFHINHRIGHNCKNTSKCDSVHYYDRYIHNSTMDHCLFLHFHHYITLENFFNRP